MLRSEQRVPGILRIEYICLNRNDVGMLNEWAFAGRQMNGSSQIATKRCAQAVTFANPFATLKWSWKRVGKPSKTKQMFECV